MAEDLFKQIQSLLGEIKTDVSKLPAGTDVSHLTQQVGGLTQRVSGMFPITQQAPNLQIPDVESNTKPAQHLLDLTPQQWFAEQEQKRQQEMERLKIEQEEAQAERKSLYDQMKDFFTGRQPIESIVRREQEALGVQTLLEQQGQLMQDIQRLRESAIGIMDQREAAISALGQQAIASPFISGQQARIAEAFDRRISSISAQMGAQVAYLQATQGQVDQARALVSDIVQAATYDQQMELNRITMFMDINRDEIAMLDTAYQRELQESQRYWERELQQAQAEREAVLNMMISHPKAGISPNDTVEKAVQKAQQWLGIQPDQDVRSLMAQFPTAGIEETDTFAQAINKIAQMPTAPERPQIFGSASTGYYEQYQTPDGGWATRRVVGAPPTGTGTGTSGIDSISSSLELILRGHTNLNDLTPTEKNKVQTEALNAGFYNEIPIPEFVEEIKKLNPGISDEDIKREWDIYREPLVPKADFQIDKEYLRAMFPEDQLLEIAMDAGFITRKPTLAERLNPFKRPTIGINIEAYLDAKMEEIERDRMLGLTEAQIYKKHFEQ